MSETKPAATAAKKVTTLRGKIAGTQLEVIGAGEPAGPQKNIETVRVRRSHDGGVRDIPRSELEAINGKEKVAAALEWLNKPTPPPASEQQQTPAE